MRSSYRDNTQPVTTQADINPSTQRAFSLTDKGAHFGLHMTMRYSWTQNGVKDDVTSTG